MNVYELIQQLSNYPADALVYLHGAIREWHEASEAVAVATTDAEQDAADSRFEAADDAEPVPVEQVDEWKAGRVVLS
jgi:hypothetical protein